MWNLTFHINTYWTNESCEHQKAFEAFAEQIGSELNAKAALEDVGHNADLYIAIQEDNTQN